MIVSVRKIALLGAVAAVAFGSNAQAASRKPTDILEYIPADTPYAFVSTQPMPDKLADRFEPVMDEVLEGYQRILRHTMSEELVRLAETEDGAEEAEKLQSFVEEITGLMSIEGIRGAGIGRDAALALYGNGLLPVLRVQLADVAAFEAAVGRLENEAGEPMPVAKIAGHDYRYVDAEGLRLVIGTFDSHAVVTIVPSGIDDAGFEQALGLKPTKNNLAKSKELDRLAKTYGLTAHFSGFVNIERVAAVFLGDPSGLNGALLELMEYDASSLSDVCRKEFADLAAVAPRVVFGYTSVNEKAIDGRVVVELRKDIAKGLETFPAAVPGLGIDPGGMMSFGISLDPMAARNFYEARLDALEAEPFECPAFAEIQAGVAKGREALQQPVPPVVYSFRGFVANITDIVGLDLESDAPPESIEGGLLLAFENAQDLVTMAAMMDPQIAALNLMPDGKPVRLDMAQLAEIAEEAFAALSETALTIAIGGGAERLAADMLVARSVTPPTFLSMNIDAARYYEMMSVAMMQEPDAEEENPTPVAIRMAMRDIMAASGKLYQRISVNVRMTERGVEIESRTTLK